MLELTGFGSVLRGIGLLYWVLAIVAVFLAIRYGKGARGKVIWTAVAIAAFGYLPGKALPGNITQVYGAADTGDSLWVANAGVHSNTYVKLFIEDQPDVQELGLTWLENLTGIKSDFGTTHSITLLADTLMVMTTLQKLMPQLTLEAMRTLLSAGSNERGIGFLGAAA